MLNLLKKFSECKVFAPVDGRCIPIEKVLDPVFSNKMMGDGVAFIFEGDIVRSPCEGQIIMIPNTKHAFGIRGKNGVEILVHIGLDTVNLRGEGFQVLVKPQTKVKAHEPIIRIDQTFMKENGMDMTLPMVVTNINDFTYDIFEFDKVNINDIIMHIKKK